MDLEAWERAHRAKRHEHRQDAQWSSPELAGFLAGSAAMPARALDLGCGTGADAVFLAEQGIETIGVDISPTALERAGRLAAQRGVEVAWVRADVLDLPFADAHVDLVLDRGCLHHVPHEDQPRYAREAARVLRPGGRLLIREMRHEGHHGHAVTEAQIRSMIAGTPLRVRSVVEFDLVGAHGPVRAALTVLDRE